MNDIDEQGMAEAKAAYLELLAKRILHRLDAEEERRYQILKVELRDAGSALGIRS